MNKILRYFYLLLLAVLAAAGLWAWPKIVLGFSSATQEWNFNSSAGFSFDSDKIEFAGGAARLKSLDQTDDANNSAGFGGGTHSATQWDSANSWVEKSASDTSTSTFTSRVFDAYGAAPWSALSWVTNRPTHKELPASGGVETAYGAGNVSMSGNLALWHLNEASGATSFADSSGNSRTGSCSGSACPTSGASGQFNGAALFDGNNDLVNFDDLSATEGISAFSAELWFNAPTGSAKNFIQPLLEKWSVSSTMATSSFSFFDMTTVSSTSKSFASGVFDGRYVYFLQVGTSGNFTRYDTTANFSAAGSYQAYDVREVSASSTGSAAAVFDGRYMYIIPVGVTNGTVTRYDTTASFTAASSYATYDLNANVSTTARGFFSAVFDGRYIYLIPFSNASGVKSGVVARYDTAANFTNSASYEVFDTAAVNSSSKGFQGAVFDGRYIYFVPQHNGVKSGQVTRYDTTAGFTDSNSYAFYDTTNVHANSKGFNGGVFDGRYVYFVPNNHGSKSGQITRYDTQADFSAAGSYAVFDMEANVISTAKGFIGANFDGRYVYFIPNNNGSVDGVVLRYDTTAAFDSAGAYSWFDTALANSSAKGHYSAVFDGRYIYFVPFNNGASFGQVARYDTTGGNASYAFRFNAQGDGFSSSVPGVTAMLNTSVGAYSVSEWTNTSSSDWHHAAMTYDGSTLNLYIDGSLKKSLAASGSIADSTVSTTLAAFNFGTGRTYAGRLDEVALYSRALSANEVTDRYLRGALRLKFQARSCDDSACSGESFIGPTGAATDYYSEATSTALGTPSVTLYGVDANRYFQYRAYFEASTSSYTPELKSAAIGPVHYPGDSPSVVTGPSARYNSFFNFSASAAADSAGTIGYQLSGNGAGWYYWTAGTGWTAATNTSQINSVAEVNANIGSFSGIIGGGALQVRSFFVSASSTQLVALSALASSYLYDDARGGPPPPAFAPPRGNFSVIINNGAATTADRLVRLKFSASDVVSNIQQISVTANADFAGAVIEPFVAEKSWDLCGGSAACPPGRKAVYVKFYNQYGFATEAYSDTIEFQPVFTPTTTPAATQIDRSPVAPVAPPEAAFGRVAESAVEPRFPARFPRNLRYGSRGEDVKALQKFLNESGFTLALSGPGAPGRETRFFGYRTWRALIKFQRRYSQDIAPPAGIKTGFGWFGPATRAFVNRGGPF